MKPSLAGAWEKWHRAIEVLETLNDEIARQDYVIPVVGKDKPDTGQYEFVVESIPETPLRWGVLVGDVVHNLRSALDHAVCAAVRLNGGNCEKPQSQFPFVSTKGQWISDRRHARYIIQLTRRERAIVRSYQPHQARLRRRPFGKPHPMTVLADLSNVDKHRILNPTFYKPDFEDPGFELLVVGGRGSIEQPPFVWDEPLKVGAEVVTATWKTRDPDAKLEMKGKIKAQVAFSNGWDVDILLHRVAGVVAAFLREFEAFFPHAKPHNDRDAIWLSRWWLPAPRRQQGRRWAGWLP